MPQKLAAKTRRKNSVKHTTNKRCRNRSFRRHKKVSRARRVVRKFGGTVYKKQDVTFRPGNIIKRGTFKKKSSGKINTGFVKRNYVLFEPPSAELMWTRNETDNTEWASLPLMEITNFTQEGDDIFTIEHNSIIHYFKSKDAELKSMLNNAWLQAQKNNKSDKSEVYNRLEKVAGLSKTDIETIKPRESRYNVLQRMPDYKGVHSFKDKWVARVRYNHTEHYIGTYDTRVEAAKAYDDYARKHKLEVPLNF